MGEKKRSERFHFEKDRRDFIIGRGILRSILGRYLTVDPSCLQFCYGNNGKPYLVNTSGHEMICFNSSKSNGVALFAFTRDREIGVDIEQIRDIPEMDLIVEIFFSFKESNLYRSLPERKKKEAFFNCWTRKEAFIKAIGDGLYFPLDKFMVSMVPGEEARLLGIERNSKGISRWSVQGMIPACGFTAAYAVEGRRCKLLCWQWLP